MIVTGLVALSLVMQTTPAHIQQPQSAQSSKALRIFIEEDFSTAQMLRRELADWANRMAMRVTFVEKNVEQHPNNKLEAQVMKSRRHFQATAIIFAMIFANSAPAYCQSPQNNPASSSRIQRVKDQVQTIGVGEDVTVILSSGLEYYGEISKVEADNFEIDEIDLKQIISIAYANVKKVEKGYGKMNSSSGKRQKGSRSKLILTIASVGASVGFLLWGISKMKSPEPPGRFPRFP
jgi:hypothetical protein